MYYWSSLYFSLVNDWFRFDFCIVKLSLYECVQKHTFKEINSLLLEVCISVFCITPSFSSLLSKYIRQVFKYIFPLIIIIITSKWLTRGWCVKLLRSDDDSIVLLERKLEENLSKRYKIICLSLFKFFYHILIWSFSYTSTAAVRHAVSSTFTHLFHILFQTVEQCLSAFIINIILFTCVCCSYQKLINRHFIIFLVYM